MLSKRLEKEGFEVTLFNSSEDFIEFLEKNKHINLFDIALLDDSLPGVSGTESLPEIRKIKTSLDLPIIMVTANDETNCVVKSLRHGANDFIPKPVNIEIALARISTQIKLSDFYKSALKSKELETLNALVTTYNHEINNPLSILINSLGKNGEHISEIKAQRIRSSAERIKDIVVKIRNLTESADINYEDYIDDTKKINLK